MPKKPEIDCQLYIPRLLYLRLTRRNSLKIITTISFILNFGLLIMGFVFLDCVQNTRSYIFNGDQFWDNIKVSNIGDNELQIYMSVIAIFTILASFFLLMNDAVIIYHAQLGGLRIRLVLTRWVNKILQILILILSIIAIIRMANIIIIFPIYLGISILGEVSSIFLYFILRKVERKELVYMLPYGVMLGHKNEYYQEYLTKTKAHIDPNQVEFLKNQLDIKLTGVDNERMFIKN